MGIHAKTVARFPPAPPARVSWRGKRQPSNCRWATRVWNLRLVAMKTTAIVISQDCVELAERLVDEGLHGSIEEAVHAGLHLLERNHQDWID
jgi:hypothetical protein